MDLARDNAAVYAVQDGDLHIHQRIGTHHIDEVSFQPGPPVADDQPSRLLNAGNQVVDFSGREREIGLHRNPMDQRMLADDVGDP